MRKSLVNPRPLRSLAAAVRTGSSSHHRSISSYNKQPPIPTDPSKDQAMPLGLYYESIINTPQPIPDKKPEGPPDSSPKKDNKDQPPSSSPPSSKSPPTKPRKSATPTTSTFTSSSSTPSSSSAKEQQQPSPAFSPSSTVTGVSSPTLSPQQQARIVFGSRLLGPAERAERLDAVRSQSRLIAGVLVPPRPEEPDNCCMSGCVNCVWDRYRDEIEDWAAANSEAERRLRAQDAGLAVAAGLDGTAARPDVSVGAGSPGAGLGAAAGGVASMDEDGGGSETNWAAIGGGGGGGGGAAGSTGIAKDFWDDELYRNVPVGIREFMKQEKRLKQKHIREGTVGG